MLKVLKDCLTAVAMLGKLRNLIQSDRNFRQIFTLLTSKKKQLSKEVNHSQMFPSLLKTK